MFRVQITLHIGFILKVFPLKLFWVGTQFFADDFFFVEDESVCKAVRASRRIDYSVFRVLLGIPKPEVNTNTLKGLYGGNTL